MLHVIHEVKIRPVLSKICDGLGKVFLKFIRADCKKMSLVIKIQTADSQNLILMTQYMVFKPLSCLNIFLSKCY